MVDRQQYVSDSFFIFPPTDDRWLAFLRKYPQANIFHHPAWSELLAECYGFHPFIFTICDKNGEIQAGLPVMEIKNRITGCRWVSLPFTDHCSPLHSNDAILDCLVNGLLDQASANGIRKLELRGKLRTCPRLIQFSPYVLHTLQLNDNFSEIDSHIHLMHRRNARTAVKRGVYIEISNKPEHLKAFYRLHIETRHKQGVPVQPWRFFDLIGKILLEKDLGFVFLAYIQEKIIAGMVLLCWGQTLTYKYGASSLDSLYLHPNDLLFRTAIEWGSKHGFKVFDFGRTDMNNGGLRAFKSGWGAEETPLTYSELSEKSAQQTSSRLMPLINIIIRNSPPWVCRSVGELLYRYFA